MPDSITSASDAELIDIARQIVTVATANPTTYGSSAPVVTVLDGLTDTFETDLGAHVAAQAAAKAATQTKEGSRDALEVAIRNFRNVAKAANTPEANMAELGIPSSSIAAPPTATQPAAQVDTSERMRHTISWSDAAANGNKKRPRGAMGAEIWVKVDGPPPGSEKDCTFLTLDSATPYLAEYDAADAGKTAHYMIRWRMRDGSLGSWGETVSATITA